MIEINQLKEIIETRGNYDNIQQGIIFCFGTSFVSQLIRAKTRQSPNEIVPSHVALYYQGFIYESTTEKVDVNGKRIPSGVRRWQLKDYYKAEKKKDTGYVVFPCKINNKIMEQYVHYPYGKDIIVDFFFTDGSDGESDGLICSQYANLATRICNKKVPTPADMYRAYKKLIGRE